MVCSASAMPRVSGSFTFSIMALCSTACAAGPAGCAAPTRLAHEAVAAVESRPQQRHLTCGYCLRRKEREGARNGAGAASFLPRMPTASQARCPTEPAPHLRLGPTVLLMTPVMKAMMKASHTIRSTGALISTHSGGVPSSVHTPARSGGGE